MFQKATFLVVEHDGSTATVMNSKREHREHDDRMTDKARSPGKACTSDSRSTDGSLRPNLPQKWTHSDPESGSGHNAPASGSGQQRKWTQIEVDNNGSEYNALCRQKWTTAKVDTTSSASGSGSRLPASGSGYSAICDRKCTQRPLQAEVGAPWRH